MIERMFLAGVPVRDDLIFELARLVDDSAFADNGPRTDVDDPFRIAEERAQLTLDLFAA